MERQLERIGIYGGTFDPIHYGHLKVATALSSAFSFAHLLFIPAFVPPHKRTQTISSPWHRYAMLALATAASETMKLSSIELDAPARPWTIETLRQLQQRHASAQLFFLMGADSFNDITSWREYARLLSEFHVVVALRPGYETQSDLGAHLAPELRNGLVDLRGGKLPDEAALRTPHTWLTDYVEIDLSSSEIREAARQGHTIENFVPIDVARYIEKYRLYRQNDLF